MGGTGDQPPSSAPPGPPPRPIINLPPRTSMDTLFNGGPSGGAFGFSPGPMTLVSSLFNENDDFKSFSQLLAGAMSSPVAAERKDAGEVGGDGGGGFKQNRPSGLAVVQSPTFTVPPGLSPAGLLDSPRFFSASQGTIGMSHQQALAQFTAQAAQANPKMHIRDENPSSASAAPAATSNTRQLQMPPHSMPDSGTSTAMKECADDGFNWRKYGQKQVKGSEFPRSYYKCTHPNCPVKKKVERSLDDDHVVAIIYRGQHNHQPPRPNKRAKDTAETTSSENSNMRGNFDLKEGTTCESTAEHVSEGSSDSEEAGDRETEVEEKNDEPDPKRRNTEARVSEGASSHRTAMEPRIMVQTTSEVDLLDDGYRWRKYGQKIVKGNPYPRSYYKCTTAGCNVRKHVERASTDPKAVITTYEGRHNHDVPAAKTNSHTIANNTASQLRPHNTTISEKHSISSRGIGAKEQQPVARLRLKEEQIT